MIPSNSEVLGNFEKDVVFVAACQRCKFEIKRLCCRHGAAKDIRCLVKVWTMLLAATACAGSVIYRETPSRSLDFACISYVDGVMVLYAFLTLANGGALKSKVKCNLTAISHSVGLCYYKQSRGKLLSTLGK